MATLEEMQAEFDALMRSGALQQQQMQADAAAQLAAQGQRDTAQRQGWLSEAAAQAERDAQWRSGLEADAAAQAQRDAQWRSGLEADAAAQAQRDAQWRSGLEADAERQRQASEADAAAQAQRDAAFLAWNNADIAYGRQETEKLQKDPWGYTPSPYALADPLAYYQAFGSIPVNSLGKSRYGIDPNTWATDTAQGAEGIKYLTPEAGATYTLYSPRSGKTLGTASTPEELAALAKMAQEQSSTLGHSADWELTKSTPGSSSPELLASNYYNSDLTALGKIVAGALPAVAALAVPGLGLVGGALGGALGAAGGTALSGAMKGDSLGSILKNSALAGGLSYGVGSLLGGTNAPSVPGSGGAAGSPFLPSGVGGPMSAAAEGAVDAVPEIVVTGAKAALTPAQIAAIVAGAGGVALGAGLGGAAGSSAGTATGGLDAATDMPPEVGVTDPVTGEIVVSAGQAPIGAGATSALDAIAAATPALTNVVPPTSTLEQLANPSNAAGGPAASVPEQPAEAIGEEPITVTATPKPLPIGDVTGALTSTVLSNTVPSTPETNAQSTGQTDTTQKSTLDKVIDALKAAGIITGLVGGATGSSSGTGGTIPGGIGGPLPSIFTDTLPSANLPGLGGGANAGPRTPAELAGQGLATNKDWYRYGYGPEQSFFKSVPQAAPNTSTAFTGYAKGGAVDYDYEAARRAGIKPDEFGHMPDTYKLPNHMTFSSDSVYSTPEHEGGKWIDAGDGHWVFWPSDYNARQHPLTEMADYFRRTEQDIPGRPDSYAVYPSEYRMSERKAKGGRSFAVRGKGDGRSDDIPAMLSDGEYVIDAETVAMLGDGSNEAGAKKLDKFRVNIRKHKGRQLAAGKISANAKAPERYLSGGRT